MQWIVLKDGKGGHQDPEAIDPQRSEQEYDVGIIERTIDDGKENCRIVQNTRLTEFGNKESSMRAIAEH